MPTVPISQPSLLVGDIIEETRRHLLGTHRAELNRLSATLTSSATSMLVDFDLEGIVRGSYVAIDDEVIYVWSTDPSSRQLTNVQRGQLGTTPATHSTGAIMEVNPRFPRSTIRYAMKEEIRSWVPRLYQVLSKTINVADDIRGYDLTTLGGFIQILEVRHSNFDESPSTNPKSWPRVHNWQIIRQAPTTDFSGGAALVIPDTYVRSYSNNLPTLNVLYAAPFDVDTAFTDSTDLVGTVGLSPTMVGIVAIGTAWRLMSTREIKRTFTEGQGEPADYQNVPPDYIGRTAARLKLIRDQQIADAQAQLRATFPMAGWG